jgi:acyl-CoA thioesterase-1
MLSTYAMASTTNLLILGDSLSAGYRLSAEQAWPSLLDTHWQQQNTMPRVINGSISGDTSEQGLARLPALLSQYHPRWVVIELGANDGLLGYATSITQQNLLQIIQLTRQSNAQPLLMQIRLPRNLGQRYINGFEAIYPALAQQQQIPLLPFFMSEVVIKPQWMQDDGLHPNQAAQPFIANWMDNQLKPWIKPSQLIATQPDVDKPH